jgi:hypothetical protein
MLLAIAEIEPGAFIVLDIYLHKRKPEARISRYKPKLKTIYHTQSFFDDYIAGPRQHQLKKSRN